MGVLDCPQCGKRGARRRGVHFDHEYRCGECSVVWNPDERTPMAISLKVVNDVLGERIKQSLKYSSEHDDRHDDGSIALTAAMIADPSGALKDVKEPMMFTEGWERPLAIHVHGTKTRRNQLVIAAAMLVAEIERLDRKEPGND